MVFSAYTMSAISLGFDTFQEHLCTHEPTKTSILNQVVCEHCSAMGEEESDESSTVKFAARSLSVDEIPRVFAYERVSTLMLWRVDATVV